MKYRRYIIYIILIIIISFALYYISSSSNIDGGEVLSFPQSIMLNALDIFTEIPSEKNVKIVTFVENVTATLGFFVAAAAAIITFISYQVNARSQRGTHMHNIFRDYLKFKADASLREKVLYGAETANICLYTLEQMYEWTKREENILKIPLAYFLFKRKEHEDYVLGWRATIILHAYENKKDIIRNITEYAPCYGVDFIEFLGNGLNNDILKNIAISEKKKRKDHNITITDFDNLPRNYGKNGASTVKLSNRSLHQLHASIRGRHTAATPCDQKESESQSQRS